MFGYATDETEECMPLTVVLSHKLNKRLSDLRRSGELPWARPDTKTQVNHPHINLIPPEGPGNLATQTGLCVWSYPTLICKPVLGQRL